MWNAKIKLEQTINGRVMKVLFGVLAAALLGLANPQQTLAQLTSDTTSTTAATTSSLPVTTSSATVTKETPMMLQVPNLYTGPRCTANGALINAKMHINQIDETSGSGNTHSKFETHTFGVGQEASDAFTVVPGGAQYEYSDFTTFEVQSNQRPTKFFFEEREHLIRQGETTQPDDWFMISRLDLLNPANTQMKPECR